MAKTPTLLTKRTHRRTRAGVLARHLRQVTRTFGGRRCVDQMAGGDVRRPTSDGVYDCTLPVAVAAIEAYWRLALRTPGHADHRTSTRPKAISQRHRAR